MTLPLILRPRWIVGVSYLSYSLAGLLLYIFGGPILSTTLGQPSFIVWNTLLILGSTTALIGSLFKSYWLEIIGLPGVITGLLLYGIVLTVFATRPESQYAGLSIAFASILLGAAMGSVGRLYEVIKLVKVVGKVSRGYKDE